MRDRAAALGRAFEEIAQRTAQVPAWAASAGLHALITLGVLAMIWDFHPKSKVDFEVLTAPAATSVARPQTAPAKPQPEVAKPRAVFGMSRSAVQADAAAPGIEVKAGNTVAKAPDDDKLRPGDADSLPVPADEYLVSKMPVVRGEFQIPYPPEAKKAGLQGPVVMDLLIDAQGNVRQAVLVQGPGGGLNEAALAGIKQFKFDPASVDGKPVAVKIRYAHRFVLDR